MKILLLTVLVLNSCSTWKQKDFEKDLNRPSTALPQVTVEDKNLLEKFEVKTVEEVMPVEETKAPPAAPSKKTTAKAEKPKVVKATEPKVVVAKKPAPEVVVAPPAKPVPPKDYPADIIELNKKGEKVWKQYKPNHFPNEKIYLDIHYLGMTVGKIMVVNQGQKSINGKQVWHFHARFKSAPFYSNIYELNDTVDTYVTTDEFLSTRYSLIQRESKQSVDDLQLHDRDQFKTFWFYKQKKSDGTLREKTKEAPIPYYSVDPFSILFLFQGLPLKDGDIYEIPLINKSKMLVLRSVVEGREKIETEHGDKKAIRVHATTKYSGEHLKSGDIYLWFSDDSRRTLLKASAKIKIGSVTADLVK